MVRSVAAAVLLCASGYGQAPPNDSLAAGADSLRAVATGFLKAGKYDSARIAFEAEVATRRTIRDSIGWAKGLNSLSEASWRTGDYRKGVAAARQALAIITATVGDEDTLAAQSYNNLGICSNNLCDYEKALAYHNQALAIRLKNLGPGHPEVARSYNNLGTVHAILGDYPKALEFHHKALAIWLTALGPDHPYAAASYNNIGNVWYELGDFGKALENYRQALAIKLKTLGPDHPGVAYSYGSLANIYGELGDYDTALDNVNKALAIRLAALGPDHPEVAATYEDIGSLLYDRGDYEQELEYYNKALAIWLKALGPDHPYAAASYHNIGIADERLGRYPGALENLTKALAIWLKALGPDHPYVARSYYYIGVVCGELGDYAKGLENLNRALKLQLKVLGPDHPSVAGSYWGRAVIYRAQAQPERALENLRKAIAVTERVRAGVQSEELRQTFTERKRNVYDEIITLLLELGRPREAFEYFERSKSKRLKDELQKKGVEIGRGELKQKIGAARALALQVGALERQVVEERARPAREQNRLKIDNLTRLLARTTRELDRLVLDIKRNPDYAFAVEVDPFRFASIRQDLPDGLTLVMYYSSADRLAILTVSNQRLTAQSVEITRDSLDTLVKRLRTELERGADDPDRSAPRFAALSAILHARLITPVQDQISAAREIIFIPSGNLCYIPFGALGRERNGSFRFLVEDKPVGYLTSAELFRYVERKGKPPISRVNPSGSPDVMLVGNPAGADLPSAAEETRAIHGLYPGSKLYLGAEAKKATVVAEAASCQVLHLATHAYADPRNPWDSYVYLVKPDTGTGHWTMAEVTGQTWDRMALVTLSACETAVGGDNPGLEMESIARAFMIAGSPTIVASLCPVSDQSTRDLMVAFYTNLKTMTKVNALRQAQLSVMKNRTTAHPFYWAPFILIGDGR